MAAVPARTAQPQPDRAPLVHRAGHDGHITAGTSRGPTPPESEAPPSPGSKAESVPAASHFRHHQPGILGSTGSRTQAFPRLRAFVDRAPTASRPATASLPGALNTVHSRRQPPPRDHLFAASGASTRPRPSRPSAPGCPLLRPSRAEAATPNRATGNERYPNAHRRETSGTRRCSDPLPAIPWPNRGRRGTPSRTAELAVPPHRIRSTRSRRVGGTVIPPRRARSVLGGAVTSTHQQRDSALWCLSIAIPFLLMECPYVRPGRRSRDRTGERGGPTRDPKGTGTGQARYRCGERSGPSGNARVRKWGRCGTRFPRWCARVGIG